MDLINIKLLIFEISSNFVHEFYHENRERNNWEFRFSWESSEEEGFASGTRWKARRQCDSKGGWREKKKNDRNYRKNYSRDAIVRIATETAAALVLSKVYCIIILLPISLYLVLSVWEINTRKTENKWGSFEVTAANRCTENNL